MARAPVQAVTDASIPASESKAASADEDCASKAMLTLTEDRSSQASMLIDMLQGR
jgi:hypothetical protein